MSNINIKFVQLEQGIKNLIAQSELPITIVESILKNISYEISEQKREYLLKLSQELQLQPINEKQEESLVEEE